MERTFCISMKHVDLRAAGRNEKSHGTTSFKQQTHKSKIQAIGNDVFLVRATIENCWGS